MNEFELYTRILAPKFIADNQNVLIEDKLAKPQKVDIINKNIESYTVYRYDLDKSDFLPFMNGTHDKGFFHSLEGLKKFCDYILLVNKNDKLFILLIEMKSGDSSNASVQLEASAVFMDYIKETAMRISRMNDYNAFDKNNIITRRIVLKPFPRSRPGTNIAKNSQINWGGNPIIYPSNQFPIFEFCNLHHR